jgi:anti-sigma factor RsiW
MNNDEHSQQTGGAHKRPSSLEIGEYELGLLPPARAHEVAAYLRQHPHAAAQLDTLRQFMSELDPQPQPQPGVLEKFTILVAQLVRGTPLMAGVRGGQEDVYQAREVQIALGMDVDMDNPTQRVLIGVGVNISGTAELWSASQPQLLQTADLDEYGNFMLTAIPIDVYELVIRGAETAVHIPGLHIG